MKQHLLPRILLALKHAQSREFTQTSDENERALNSVLFKNDRIYHHNLARLNYTTYDVRRAQEAVNASTSHHNVMVLADHDHDGDNILSERPFRYARVLGIYHANTIYVGPGMQDYQPVRMEFLWVRWYCDVEMTNTGWDSCKLDRIKFPAMSKDDAFGFIDPSDVVRGCHIIPRFAGRKRHLDGIGLSFLARDSSDWLEYYVDR